ncbi:hypothetical protein PENTCL1PPCAC_23995, partial [Pristionchus entomophagus]
STKILEVCPNFSLTHSSFFSCINKMDREAPIRIKNLLQAIINKERCSPGSSGGAEALYNSMHAWRTNRRKT